MVVKINIFKQGEENYLLHDDTPLYYKNLQDTFDLINKSEDLEFLRFAYISICASTLEASLNHLIFDHFINLFGPIDFKKYSDTLITTGFKNKLNITPVVVTNSNYYFNQDCFVIKSLEELISLRNKMLHKKPIIQKTHLDLDDISIGAKLTFAVENNTVNITKNKCEKFHKAILRFKNEFMDPILNRNEIRESDLIKKR